MPIPKTKNLIPNIQGFEGGTMGLKTPGKPDFKPSLDAFSRMGINQGKSYEVPALGQDMNWGAPPTEPAVAGSWFDKEGKGGMALGVADIGLGVYNAFEQSKMNKFMRGYYGDQMDLQRADFENVARSANEQLAARQGRILSSQGAITGTEANKANVASYMDQWGVRESF